MIKKFYSFAWLVLTGSVVASIFMGQLDPIRLLAFSLAALALVYALLLWSVFANTRDMRIE